MPVQTVDVGGEDANGGTSTVVQSNARQVPRPPAKVESAITTRLDGPAAPLKSPRHVSSCESGACAQPLPSTGPNGNSAKMKSMCAGIDALPQSLVRSACAAAASPQVSESTSPTKRHAPD